MKKTSNYILTLITVLLLACKEEAPIIYDVLNEVNMIIGTDTNGRIIPVAVVPHGMVQVAPDTRYRGSGYHYRDSSIIGFSHTHKSGGGCGDFQDILLQPSIGKLNLKPGDKQNPDSGYRSRFNHEEENASPGLYQVKLSDYDIDVSITATKRCGFHKYQFNHGKDAHIILDLIHRNKGACTIIKEEQYDTTTAAYIHIIDDQHIEGFRVSEGWSEEMHAYFAIKFSRPFEKSGILDNHKNVYNSGVNESSSHKIRANFDFDINKDNILLVKVGISPVSMENAWENLDAEIPSWDFEKVVSENKSKWRKELKKFKLTGGTKEQRILFYTGIYNVLVYPMLYMDLNGQYRGPDHKVHKALDYEHYGGYIGTWDVFRAANPLLTLIKPEVANDYVKTMLSHYEIHNLLPLWVLAGHESHTMQGFHSVPMIADTYFKGIQDYDVQKVYEAIITTAMKDSFGISMGRLEGLKNYKQYGYIPADLEFESVAKTLEYAYDDWTVAQMARMLGYKEDYEYFLDRSQSYKNVFDTTTNFMRGRMKDGSWKTPFDPFFSHHRRDEFMEGTAWQWTFFVPHDPGGLADLMGGDLALANKLDTLFTVESPSEYNQQSGAITGLIGQYAHGNEVSQHIPYMYNYCGQPWKTQFYVKKIKETLYKVSPDGYCGNEDTGQMSAWYVFSSMGFYPVNHGTGVYIIGTPGFEKIEFDHNLGGTLIITANNISRENLYIQSVRLNGEHYTKSFFNHHDIFNQKKVTIEFEMGNQPNFQWGTNERDYPPSISGNEG